MSQSEPSQGHLADAWERMLDLAEAAYSDRQSVPLTISRLVELQLELRDWCTQVEAKERQGLQQLDKLLEIPIKQGRLWEAVDWAEWLADIPTLAQLRGIAEKGDFDETVL